MMKRRVIIIIVTNNNVIVIVTNDDLWCAAGFAACRRSLAGGRFWRSLLSRPGSLNPHALNYDP